MDQRGDFLDVGLKQAARVRVGQHDAGDVVRLCQLGFQVFDVDAAGLAVVERIDHIEHPDRVRAPPDHDLAPELDVEIRRQDQPVLITSR